MASWTGALFSLIMAVAISTGQSAARNDGIAQPNPQKVTTESTLPLQSDDAANSLFFDEDTLSYVTNQNCSRPIVARIHINPMKSAYRNWVMPKSQKEAGLLAFSFCLTAALAFTPFVCRWALDGLLFLLSALFPVILGDGHEQEL